MDGAAQKVDLCEKSSCNLQQSLTELESQRDDAKSLINETFQVNMIYPIHWNFYRLHGHHSFLCVGCGILVIL